VPLAQMEGLLSQLMAFDRIAKHPAVQLK
jgi:hypothetical protein